MLQNAVDAGATRVDCLVEELPDGQYRCTCIDNGSGMDEHTLYDVFLVAGATSKSEQDTGGFGQAIATAAKPGAGMARNPTNATKAAPTRTRTLCLALDLLKERIKTSNNSGTIRGQTELTPICSF